jgi:hypothetical protein
MYISELIALTEHKSLDIFFIFAIRNTVRAPEDQNSEGVGVVSV